MAKFEHVTAVIIHVAADIAHDAAKSGQKFPCLKAVLLFFDTRCSDLDAQSCAVDGKSRLFGSNSNVLKTDDSNSRVFDDR